MLNQLCYSLLIKDLFFFIVKICYGLTKLKGKRIIYFKKFVIFATLQLCVYSKTINFIIVKQIEYKRGMLRFTK